MSLYRITDIAGLHRHLHAAIQLEHATLPPYLTALYSIHPGTNSAAYQVIRAVAVEEMLHLTLSANILNAVGGSPDLTQSGFMPLYPAYLPDGETDFQVDIRPFSKEALQTFLKIERPAHATHETVRTVRRKKKAGTLSAARIHDESEEHFYSIGEFYKAIEDGLTMLQEQQGDALFSGDPARQITPDYYYSGGGEVIPVTDLESACAAIRLISEQGEGFEGGIFDYEGEISHYFRFQQIMLGRYYRPGDQADHPSGGPVDVDWSAAYPTKTNPRLADYPEGSELHQAALTFNRTYAEFLALLTRAFQGEPQLLIEAIGWMFRLKEQAYQLMHQPLDPAGTVHAAPTFEV